MSISKLCLPRTVRASRDPEARTLATASHRQSNLDTIRASAALAVLVSHSFQAAYGSDAAQPLEFLSHGQTVLGTVAVLVFFVISGYLVTQSFQRTPDPVRFLRARALRIFPGLYMALLLAALVLGPAMTSLTLNRYFSNPSTALYVPSNMTLLLTRYTLPGVFGDNPGGNAVNSPIWTLRYEFFMYGVVLALGIAGLLNRVAVAVVWLAIVALYLWPVGGDPNFFWPLNDKYVLFGIPFLSGALFYLWRDRVPFHRGLALFSLGVVAASLLLGGFNLAFATFGAYLVLFLAFSPHVRMPNLARKGDLSYGIYIYAWPVQQTVAHLLGKSGTWYWNVAVSVPVVLALAWLSWRLVEKPALELKRPGVAALS